MSEDSPRTKIIFTDQEEFNLVHNTHPNKRQLKGRQHPRECTGLEGIVNLVQRG